VYNAQTSHYSLIVSYKEHSYGAMPKVEEMLASYFSTQSAIVPKGPGIAHQAGQNNFGFGW